jgi:hypothetical protein
MEILLQIVGIFGVKTDENSMVLTVNLGAEDAKKLHYICAVFEESEEEIIRKMISEKATLVKITLAKAGLKTKV